jgi:PAS domain-containing protein
MILAAFTARSVWRAFEERSGQARAAAVFDLVATRTAVRPTNAPGAIAWLRRAIERSGLADRSLADPSDAVPQPLARIAGVLRGTEHGDGGDGRPPFLAPSSGQPGSARRQRIVRFRDRTLVLTRRQSLDADPASDRFVLRATPVLVDKDAFLRGALLTGDAPAVSDVAPARMVRVYAVSDDGTLLSLPESDSQGSSGEAGAVDRELAVLSTRPTLPAFAPEDFFFRSAGDAYSGFYLDLGGRGLVSTLTMPMRFPDGSTQGVIAIDLAFNVDWTMLAASLEPPIQGVAVSITPATSTSWAALAQALPDETAPDLGRALADASGRFAAAGDAGDAQLRHAVVANGAIAAFQVSDRTWLLAWFPQVAPAFPLAAVTMLGGLLAVLLAGFEVNRRRAFREQRAAERALQEKQNLLNTMQVPLVVVDPNTDAIVSANRAADAIGFRAGKRFAELVWPDARARAHYERMQVASPEPRRAYGVPVSVVGSDGQPERRYAVVRSVAVTAPIEALSADERHRLGVLVVLDEEADLALMIEDLEAAAHRDERRRLAGLLSHGVDTLARVLEHSLSRGSDPAFPAWLAEYLERRVGVTAWLLDHWDAATPLPRESVIDAAQARATIDRFQAVLALAAADRDLRQRLHWDNGTLAAPAPRTLDVTLDWPDDVAVTCPVRGGFGLFLNELVVNAVRHGTPGTVPSIAIVCDRVRGELTAAIRNDTNEAPATLDRVDPYGGLSIVRAMARLFGWPNLRFDREGPDRAAPFVASWVMPFGTRRAGEAD